MANLIILKRPFACHAVPTDPGLETSDRIPHKCAGMDLAPGMAHALCEHVEPARLKGIATLDVSATGLCGNAVRCLKTRGVEDWNKRVDNPMKRPPLVISIQSQVVFGHVGNSAALFPMQAAGLDVAAIPTVIFSNIPGYPTLRGRPLPPDFFMDLLQGARERGLMERADFILTGYIGSVEVAEMIADFVAEAKAVNPGLTYLCDPVMGDTGPGLYVPMPIAELMGDRFLPMADIATPNSFELAWLTGCEIGSLEDFKSARKSLRMGRDAKLIATGCAFDDTPKGHIESVILGPDGVSRHSTEHMPIALSGTGDLFAALIVSGLARGVPLPRAVDLAQDLTLRALRQARDLGASEVVLSEPEFRRALLTLGDE